SITKKTASARLREFLSCFIIIKAGNPCRTSTDASSSSQGAIFTKIGEPLLLRCVHVDSEDAAKADVAGRGVDRLALARCRPVAQAVVGRAQVRTAFHH